MPYSTFPRPLTTLAAVAAGSWGDSHRKRISRIPQLKPQEDERKFLGKSRNASTRRNRYVSGPGGLWILDANGKQLGTLRNPEHPHNMA